MKIRHYSTLSLAIFASFQAHAAGFQVAEHSASGLGRAFSGEAAVAQDASVIARNPAAMTRFDRAMFSGAISIIDPEVDIYDTTNMERSNDVAPLQVVPAGYYLSPINEKWAWGIGMFTTYGVATDYPDDIAAGDMAGDTSLVSVNINPSVAYRVNDNFSIGAGLNLVYAHAELNRHFGRDLSQLFGRNRSDLLISMEGDTFGWGWNIGAMYEINENHRFGFGYRSEVEIDFDDGDFTDTDGSKKKAQLVVDLPAIWELSGFHQLNDTFAIHYSYLRTEWSAFKELKATSPECDNRICFFKPEEYDDSSRYSIGTTINFNEQWIGRLGFAFDEQAGKATLSIPDSDRYWYSIGATYLHNNHWSFDAGFALVVSDDGSFTETNSVGETFNFESEGLAYITAIQANYKF
ncbi:outer membrane beta-barrel protein [Vibrio astriarenae]|uniref:Outer membrane beta-barrel protein n=1 Tax=Vibrio astriarenae TaxID=1481923 RepID=A0A7Z2YG80_9VIBR|nr:outer membrane protein transport protein [Vibrio astriarenae]QIA65870.1 outer membrane beta-barrel protein [Vibrio astriarenae]